MAGGAIRVDPANLNALASRLRSVGGEVTALAGSVNGLGGDASAFGTGAVGEAFAAFVRAWSAALSQLGYDVTNAGSLTSSGALDFGQTDAAAAHNFGGGS